MEISLTKFYDIDLMAAFGILFVSIASLLIIYFTVLFLSKVRAERRVSWKGFRDWVRNIVDSLFGIG